MVRPGKGAWLEQRATRRIVVRAVSYQPQGNPPGLPQELLLGRLKAVNAVLHVCADSGGSESRRGVASALIRASEARTIRRSPHNHHLQGLKRRATKMDFGNDAPHFSPKWLILNRNPDTTTRVATLLLNIEGCRTSCGAKWILARCGSRQSLHRCAPSLPPSRQQSGIAPLISTRGNRGNQTWDAPNPLKSERIFSGVDDFAPRAVGERGGGGRVFQS